MLVKTFCPNYLPILVVWTLALALLPKHSFAEEGTQIEPAISPEVLLRGPVHEAFAEPIIFDPQPGPVVPKQPYDPIEEIQPELTIADKTAVWIDGYWQWNEERQDFDWVSGGWRIPPRGYRWVAGYWVESGGGYRYISGFWVPLTVEAIEYQPAPPASLETGPNGAAPGDDYFWVPGCWLSNESGYRWRPGVWTRYQPGWIWVPAHYVWTPRGCIFVRGFWDHDFQSRGVLFAPVTFVHYRQGLTFSPHVTVDFGRMLMHLFVYPRQNHYYFGNFYDSHYAQSGFYSQLTFARKRGQFDPLLTYYKVDFGRRNIDYEQRIANWHQHMSDHPDLRPPQTFKEQNAFLKKHTAEPHVGQSILGETLTDVFGKGNANSPVRRLSEEDRKLWEKSRHDARQLRGQRITIEGSGGTRDGSDPQGPKVFIPDTHKLPLPKPTEPRGQSKKSDEPPAHQTQKPPLNVAPTVPGNQPRQPDTRDGPRVKEPLNTPRIPANPKSPVDATPRSKEFVPKDNPGRQPPNNVAPTVPRYQPRQPDTRDGPRVKEPLNTPRIPANPKSPQDNPPRNKEFIPKDNPGRQPVVRGRNDKPTNPKEK